MRYYCYYDYSENSNTNTVLTISEEDIRRDYYPYWYEQMCKKYGDEVVAKNCTFQDCLEDWIAVYWAWESKDD